MIAKTWQEVGSSWRRYQCIKSSQVQRTRIRVQSRFISGELLFISNNNIKAIQTFKCLWLWNNVYQLREIAVCINKLKIKSHWLICHLWPFSKNAFMQHALFFVSLTLNVMIHIKAQNGS